LTVPNVIERLQAEPAHKRRVPNDDRDLFATSANITGKREALADRDPSASMAAIEHVVRRLAPARESADAAELTKAAETSEATREKFVWVCLMASIKNDPVDG